VSPAFALSMMLLCVLSWATPVRFYLDEIGGAAILLGAIIALIGWPYTRERTWAAKGLCPKCGYDLRATPDRCPECGAVPAAAKS
jgi:hypothetical protein